jgi:uncharacterized protein
MPSEEPLPPYSFVPGGPWPHPISSPKGHWAGERPLPAQPIVHGDWASSPEYLRGVALFNAGYYWEAHEVWEALWHAHGRRGATADLLKALIKLAAAGVKVRERQPAGATHHARRAADLIESVRATAGDRQLGLDLGDLSTRAAEIAAAPPQDSAPAGTAVSRVFDFRIEPH